MMRCAAVVVWEDETAPRGGRGRAKGLRCFRARGRARSFQAVREAPSGIASEIKPPLIRPRDALPPCGLRWQRHSLA